MERLGFPRSLQSQGDSQSAFGRCDILTTRADLLSCCGTQAVRARQGGKPQKTYSLKQPNQIGTHAISRDNRRIYFNDVSGEAEI